MKKQAERGGCRTFSSICARAGLASNTIAAMPGLRMSDTAQRMVAKYLTDPSLTQEGINLLRRAGAREHDLRVLQTRIGKSAGRLDRPSEGAQAG